MNGVERAIVMEDLTEEREASRIMLDIQDTRRYFESQGGDFKSSRVAEGEVPICSRFLNSRDWVGVVL